jgi:hypothetical protein
MRERLGKNTLSGRQTGALVVGFDPALKRGLNQQGQLQ